MSSYILSWRIGDVHWKFNYLYRENVSSENLTTHLNDCATPIIYQNSLIALEFLFTFDLFLKKKDITRQLQKFCMYFNIKEYEYERKGRYYMDHNITVNSEKVLVTLSSRNVSPIKERLINFLRMNKIFSKT